MRIMWLCEFLVQLSCSDWCQLCQCHMQASVLAGCPWVNVQELEEAASIYIKRCAQRQILWEQSVLNEISISWSACYSFWPGNHAMPVDMTSDRFPMDSTLCSTGMYTDLSSVIFCGKVCARLFGFSNSEYKPIINLACACYSTCTIVAMDPDLIVANNRLAVLAIMSIMASAESTY